MLVNWTQPKHVFIVCGKTDLRKGIDGLAAVVAENYDLDLFDDSLFLFCGTRNDRFKGLYLRDSIGTGKDSSCFISVLKMVVCVGHGIAMMPSS